MESDIDEVKWAPRVKQSKILQLYKTDAKGILDEELIDDVGYAFYARCKSILTVTEASCGRIECPCCHNIIMRHSSREAVIKCKNCSWEVTWAEYHKTYKKKQLHGGGAVEIFKDFVREFPTKHSPADKMILIDKIIHECHKFINSKREQSYTRPVAVNLISGTMTQIIALLDKLAYGIESTSGMKEIKKEWREKVLSEIKKSDFQEM